MRDGTYNTEKVVRLGREIYEREVRVQVEASHDGEFVIVDVTTGAWEVDDCECRGDGVAVLVIEVGEEPGNVALQGAAVLGATKQWDEGLEELDYLGQRLGLSFGHGIGYDRSLVHAHHHAALLTK
jgi:hypothetical protein